ncbi:MAG TPA: hypothetical protein VJ934_06800 [Desulfomicrobiaceae bacterium]|nr:hypothetical protein [Desulfomicrobiaceae bacterium]
MNARHMKRPCLTGVILVVFLVAGCVGSAWAGPRHQPRDSRHRPGHRVTVVEKTRVVRIGGAPYVYRQGHLWHKEKRGTMRFRPPRKRFLDHLPRGAVRVVINGIPHFRIGAAFCLPVSGGYVRVDTPVRYDDPVVISAPASSRRGAVVQGTENVTVMVLNSNGSRTPVVLDRGDGGTWIGPKGEIYDRFPSVEQLESAYGF